MSPQEFKRRWESDDDGGGIEMGEVAECAKAWGIAKTPRIMPMDVVLYKVLKCAEVVDAEEYKPEIES